ncbi:MAG: zinc-ribbon domain containing protein [Candidatus Kerfeldbacteria bacterium]|nr:zinc-ribbon domain containing protein [Candidatus Kerfeldbacteria bacterium]
MCAKIIVPQPTLCPDCRQQRRLAWRNERNLYRDQCDLCHQDIISLYQADSPYIVYCQDCWWSDRWDPISYGRDYNPQQSFFEQMHTLQLQVPRLALFNLHSTNSEYTNHASHNKNCYMGVALGQCEDCLYGFWVLQSKNCVDNLYCEQCELCYECSYCQNCYQTYWSQYGQNLRDCLFCFECRDSSNCIGCAQLQHKQYYILNKPVTPEKFEQVKQLLLCDLSERQKMITAWEELKLKAPRRFNLQQQCESSTGDDLYNCHNAVHCFNCHNLENCKYMYDLGNNKDGMDCYEHGWMVPSELCYETHAGMAGFNFKFCNICVESRDLTYCDLCQQNCANLFGCVALRKASYCILNRQYNATDYQVLVKKMISDMIKTGEYGEFFPMQLSPFAYNESTAQEYFPLQRDQVLASGCQWYEDNSQLSAVNAQPDVQLCQQCHRSFRLVAAELKFYQETGIPQPAYCADCRHQRRMQLRNPRQLWQRQCMCTQTDHKHSGRCTTEFETTYSPDRKELVYCQKCYNKAVY